MCVIARASGYSLSFCFPGAVNPPFQGCFTYCRNLIAAKRSKTAKACVVCTVVMYAEKSAYPLKPIRSKVVSIARLRRRSQEVTSTLSVFIATSAAAESPNPNPNPVLLIFSFSINFPIMT